MEVLYLPCRHQASPPQTLHSRPEFLWFLSHTLLSRWIQSGAHHYLLSMSLYPEKERFKMRQRREQREMKTKVVCHLDPCEFLSKTGRGWKIKVKIAQVHCPMGPNPRSFVSAVCCNVSGMVHVRLMQYAKWRKSNQRLITINMFYSIYDDYSNTFQLNIVQRDINTSWTNRWIKNDFLM